MMEVTRSTWLDESEDHELVRELLDNESPLFFLPQETIQSNPSININEQTINQLVLTSYSGPTIQDIENSLSITSQKDQPQSVSHARGLTNIEDNKYTLKLKCCGNGMADDGYKWRKYGQKSIKNSPYPRSYYRCTNPRCSAKKQVERCKDEEDTFIITYEGFHLHYAYPFFLLNQPPLLPNPPAKKPKKASSESQSSSQAHEAETRAQEEDLGGPSDGPFASGENEQEQEILGLERTGPQGLLEDVVPFVVRNPSNNNSAYSTTSCSSHRSYPTSPSSLSWSPNHAYSLY